MSEGTSVASWPVLLSCTGRSTSTVVTVVYLPPYGTYYGIFEPRMEIRGEDDDLLPHPGVHVHAIATMMLWWRTRNAGVVGPYQTHEERSRKENPYENPADREI